MRTSLSAAAAAVALGLPGVAAADLLTFSIAGKGVTTGATGYLGEKWSGPLGGGAELDLEMLGVDLLGEAYIFAPDQYQLGASLGLDFPIDAVVRVTPGIFVGALIYVLPEPTTPSGFDPDELPTTVQDAFADHPEVLDRISTEYQRAAEKEEAANRTLAALTTRARVTVEYPILPVFFVGVEGSLGVHYLVSGEAETAKAKKDAIDAQKQKPNDTISDEAYDALGAAIGADSGDGVERFGLNFGGAIFLKLEI